MHGRRVLLAFGVLVALSISLSFVHPWGNLRAASGSDPILSGANLPADVRELLEAKCADCHSNLTRWPVYSKLAPGSWLVEHDVHEAREHLNLSAWQTYDEDARIDLLAKIAAELRKGKMPVKRYLWLHPAARLTNDEQQRLAAWAKAEGRRLRNEKPQP